MNTPPFTPHGPGFQFVDSLEVLEKGKKVRTKKTLHPDLPFFKDHFPGEPLFPGVLMIESAAQAAGCVWGSIASSTDHERYAIARVQQFQIKHPAFPTQTLTIEATLEKDFGTLGQFQVEISVDHQLIAQGTIVLSRTIAHKKNAPRISS